MRAPEPELVIDAASGTEAPAATALPPWLELLQAGGSGDLSSMIAALLARQSAGGAGSDTMTALLQMMQARGAPSASTSATTPAEEAATADLADAETPAADATDVRALVEHARAMEQELEMLRQRSDSLAAALGACYLCFGQEAACPVCRGRGAPGRRPPQPRYFDFWIQPVLDRWNPDFDLPRPRGPARPARRPEATAGMPAGNAPRNDGANRSAPGTGPPPHVH